MVVLYRQGLETIALLLVSGEKLVHFHSCFARFCCVDRALPTAGGEGLLLGEKLKPFWDTSMQLAGGASSMYV